MNVPAARTLPPFLAGLRRDVDTVLDEASALPGNLPHTLRYSPHQRESRITFCDGVE